MPVKTVRSVVPKAKKPKPQMLAWSYSRLNMYEECPQKTKFKHLDKLPEPAAGKAMQRGSKIHEECETWLRSKETAIPESMKLFAREFRTLRKITNLQIEQQWAFTNEWKPADWFDTTGNTWVRIVVDAAGIVNKGKKLTYRIIDFKTGKVRDKNDEQLELYGIAGFHLQGVDAVQGELWYLDSGDIVELKYSLDEMAGIEKKWRSRANILTRDRLFAPTPSHSNCQWCAFKKAKGGPCQY